MKPRLAHDAPHAFCRRWGTHLSLPYVQVAKGRIVSSSHDILETVFDDPIAIGKYVIALYTRCGHGANYRVVRVSRKIRAVG